MSLDRTDGQTRRARRPVWRMSDHLYRVADSQMMALEPAPIATSRPAPSPDRLLMMAVLEQAMEDIETGRRIRRGPLPPSYRDARNRRKLHRRDLDADDALRWVLGQPMRRGYGYTFEQCCEAADLGPDAVRDHVRRGKPLRLDYAVGRRG